MNMSKDHIFFNLIRGGKEAWKYPGLTECFQNKLPAVASYGNLSNAYFQSV